MVIWPCCFWAGGTQNMGQESMHRTKLLTSRWLAKRGQEGAWGLGDTPPVNQLPPTASHFLMVLPPSRSIQLGTRPLGHTQRGNYNTWISPACGVCCLVSGSHAQTLLKKKLLFLCLVMGVGDGGCPCVSLSLHEAHACLDFKEGVGDVSRTSLLFYSYVKAALSVI